MVPDSGGMFMPHVSEDNANRDRQESFTISGTFAITTNLAIGQIFSLYLPVDQDGDFWCDQIGMQGWGAGLSLTFGQPALPLPGFIDIVDARTGLSLCWPQASLPTEFLVNRTNFTFNGGLGLGSLPYPQGFRPTGILPQPHCFTRGGGIQLILTSAIAWAGNAGATTDISFSGWKEYEFASS